MATYSRADLRNAVLHELGVLDINEAAEAEDAALCTDRCQQQLELLNERGLTPFDIDSDAIPATHFYPLVRVIADTLAMPYGVGSRADALAANAERGMRELYRLKNLPHYGTTPKATYF